LRMVGVGISFGNTSAFVSVHRDGRAEIVANSDGERSTATIVAHQEGEILTGTPAGQMLVRQPANTVRHLKSMLGRKLKDIDVRNQTCKLEEHNDEIIVNFNNVSRKGVSTLVKNVFDNLKETADSSLGGDKHDAVIAVPLNSSQEFRNVISKCALSAGFNVLDLIPEPIAALLADDTIHEDGHVVVLRVGGFTMSITLVKVCSGMFSVVDHVDEDVGGRMLDSSIGKFLCGDFNKKHKCAIEENPRSYSKILKASKSTKHNLSTMNTSEINIESLYEGADLCTNLSRPRFETLIQADLSKITGLLKTFTEKHAGVGINRVVLAGGCCKVTKLQSLVGSIFTGAKLSSQASDEITSMGAAHHVGMVAQYSEIKGKTEVEANGTVAVPTTPSAINVRIGDSLTKVVPKNAPLPFTIEVQLPEGNEIVIEADGKCLACAKIPKSEDSGTVSLHMEIFEDCGIEAIIKDCSTNERTSVHIPAPTIGA